MSCKKTTFLQKKTLNYHNLVPRIHRWKLGGGVGWDGSVIMYV
jgi:hypothetical protein